MSPERAQRYAAQRRDFALIMSMAWVFYGLAIVVTYPDKDARSLQWLPEGFSGVDVTGLYIIAFALVALVGAFIARRHHWGEYLAYITLFGAPVLRGIAAFIGAWIDFSETGWTTGTRFIVMAIPAAYVSGLRPSDAQIQRAKETAPNVT